MIALVPPTVPAPLFRIVRTVMPSPGSALPDYVELSDARRDGSAVGNGASFVGIFRRVRNVYVLGGRWRQPEEPLVRDIGREVPKWRPTAILVADRVLVHGANPSAPNYVAHVGERLSVTARRVGRARPSAQTRAYWFQEHIAVPPEWTNARVRRAGPFRRAPIAWTRVRGGDLATLQLLAEGRDEGRPPRIPIFRSQSGIRPLADHVAGGPDLESVLWTSPEGWLVATVFQSDRLGLAWLEPVRR